MSSAAISELPVLNHGEDGYEERRRSAVWHARTPARFPSAIATPSSVAEVAAAVGYARERGLRVGIRSGGHHAGGLGLHDGQLLIDLSSLTEVAIDQDGRSASVQPGVTGGVLTEALARRGLGFPVPHDPRVALGGYLLSGGFGWNMPSYGPACLSITEVEVVLADGQLVQADHTRNRDLLWAARGGGAGFPGIVTRFRVALHPAPRHMVLSAYGYDLSKTAEVIEWLCELEGELAREVELGLALVTAPDGVRQLVLRAVAFDDSLSGARAGLAPLESCPVIAAAHFRRTFEETTPQAMQAWSASLCPSECRVYGDTFWSDAPASLLPELAIHYASAPARRAIVNNMLARQPVIVPDVRADAAFSIHGRLWTGLWSYWDRPEDDAVNLDWIAATSEPLEASAVGFYVGQSNFELPDRACRSFDAASWDRLQHIRRTTDPQGLFCSYGFPAP
ncbi:MAG: FAD-binding oxidoreductase [Solirubrobacterales bacterium]|nr:FAD-binding oxidoreductase [Solirubrobacterales bacterium]